MALRLNQVLAEERSIKSRADQVVTDLHQRMQKPALLGGLSKTYRPAVEPSSPEEQEKVEKFPPEYVQVQLKASDALREIHRSLLQLFEITAKKDATNCVARADVVIDGKVVVKDVPATHLLWLEKQLTLLRSVVEKTPVLDPSEKWKLDASTGLFATDPVERARQEKEQKPLVLFPATKEHPAQTQLVTVDRVVGYWTHVKFSGARPDPEVKAMVERLDKAIRAVKSARAQANMTEAAGGPSTAALLEYVLSDGK
jgi:hypothetical protein